MAFYDRIARQWHAQTGFRGGALKEHVLNGLLIEAIGAVADRAILELGAGNGYFMPLLLRRHSGQHPARLVITDQSTRQIEHARKYCPVAGAEYARLDIRHPFPFPPTSFDLILATMVFNEVSSRGLRAALAECRRVLRPGGLLLATVTHPDFVASLDRRGQLRRHPGHLLTMPGSSGLRLPVCRTSRRLYEQLFHEAGLDCVTRDVLASPEVLSARPGLRNAGKVPLALVLNGTLPAAAS